ncbi:aminoacyl-tRNA hydrolase [bacterium]|nr:aminoacyl-tRNA hydrolase [bacterium]
MTLGPHLLVGLGNPGRQYLHTRHNLGFMLLDLLALRYAMNFKAAHPLYYECRLRIHGQDLIMIKPMSYMNRSGVATALALSHFQGSIDNMLISFDDLAIPLGRLRLRGRGSDGGHNGLASIQSLLNTSSISRLRLGMGPATADVTDFVLSPFGDSELEVVTSMLEKSADAVELWLEHGLVEAMNRYNKV